MLPNVFGIKSIVSTTFLFFGLHAAMGQIHQNERADSSNKTMTTQTKVESNFSVYPNPVTKGILTIERASDINAEILLFNKEGKLVYSMETSSKITSISNLFMSPGLYLLQINVSDGSKKTTRIIFK